MDAQRLHGETAIVTGADSGIGRATAIAFAREGADVALTYFHDEDGARETAAAIESAGRRAFVAQLDQRDAGAVAAFFNKAHEALGTATILVNNAGRNFSGKRVRDMDDGEWDAVIRTNLYGPFYCCREFIRAIDGRDRHGCIINITSVHQEISLVGAAAYACSKGGLRNLTTTLALELAENDINVNNIAPGMILTPMNQQAIDDAEQRRQQEASIPVKRAGTPEEVAQAAVFLASNDARYIHGTTIVIDGALMLQLGQGA